MHRNYLQKFFVFLKRILHKIRPRFSFHYIAYTSLFILVIFSALRLVSAVTPNPGHPWTEVGDGVITFTNGQEVTNYTYTLPAANATILTTHDGVKWNEIANPSATQSLSFDDAELTTWDILSNTETFHTYTANSLTTGKILSLLSSSLTSGTLLDLSSAGTGALTGQKGLNISLSGANGTGAQTTYGSYISNTHTGTSTNVGLYATASGGSNNYAAIFQNGNVGIGTTAPTEKVEVVGKLKIGNNTVSGENITFDGSTSAGMRVSNSSGYISITPLNASWAHIYTDRANFIFDKPVYSIANKFSSYSTGNLELQTGGVTRITALASNGNVGIGDITPDGTLDIDSAVTTGVNFGITNTGVYTGTGLLSVVANSATTGTLGLMTANGLSSGSILSLTSAGTAGLTNQKGLNIALSGTNATSAQTTYGAYISNTHAGTTSTNVGLYATATGGTTANYAAIFQNGNVGIGTTSPTKKLEVAGDTLITTTSSLQPLKAYQATYQNFSVDYPSSPSIYTTQLNFGLLGRLQYDGNGGVMNIENTSTQAGSAMRFFMGTTERLRITDTGNVGIGTTAPLSKMGVLGNLSVGGTYGAIAAPTGGAIIEGNVGIGTTSPTHQLTVTGAGTAAYMGYNSGGNLQFKFQGANNSTPNFVIDGTGTADLFTVTDSNISVFVIKDGGNVGIGTTAPSGKLVIKGAGTTTGIGLQTQNSSGTALVTMLDNGNVGIGTTNPTGKLHFKASGTGYGAGGIRFEQSADSSYWDIMPSWNALFFGRNGGTFYQMTEGGLGLGDGGTNFTYIARSGNSYFNAGNVGIGTVSPGARLSVVGADSLSTSFAANISGATGTGLVVANNGNVGIGTTVPDEKLEVYGNAPNIILRQSGGLNNNESGRIKFSEGLAANFEIHYSGSNDELTFETGGINLMTIERAGNVGIGTVSPGARLSVVGADSLSTSFAANISGATGTGLVVANNGNVGIGTTNPVNTFQIGSVGSYSNNLIAAGNGTAAFVIRANGSDINQYSGSSMRFFTGFTERMILHSSGNVGIGTVSPGARLSVVGADSLSTSFAANISGATGTGLVVANNGNVGIGTTSPGAKLEVKDDGIGNVLIGDISNNNSYGAISLGNSLLNTNYNFASSPTDTNLYINRPTGKDILFREADGIAQVIIKTGGNVGIGTTAPLSKMGVLGNLSVGGTYGAIAAPTGGAIIEGNVGIGTTAPSGKLVIKGAGTTTGIGLQTQNSSGTALVTMLDNGNVGIGTTAPTQKLEVSGGSVRITNATLGAGIAPLVVQNTNAYADPYTQYSQVWLNSSGSPMSWVRNDGKIYSLSMLTTNGYGAGAGSASTPQLFSNYNTGIFFPATDGIGFTNAGVESMRILSTGNVGIGTVSPGARLSVVGADSLSTSFAANISGATGTGLVVANNGNVGIGTTSPQAKLDIGTGILTGGTYSATSRNYLDLSANSNAYYPTIRFSLPSSAIQFVQSGTSALIQGYNITGKMYFDSWNTSGLIIRTGNDALNSTNPIQFYINASELMRITSTGNVGIGTVSPGARLSVVGANSLSTSFAANISGATGTGLVVANNGNVGIGTISPGAKLRVHSNYTENELTLSGLTNSSFGTISDIIIQPFTLDTNYLSDYTRVGVAGISARTDAVGGNAIGVLGVGQGTYTSGSIGGKFVGKAVASAYPAYGVKSKAISYAGSNGYGLYVDTGNGDGTNWGIYQEGTNDKNYFAGNVGIGTTSPTATLEVFKTGAVSPIVLGAPVLVKFASPSGTVPWALRQNASESATPVLQWFETSDGDLGAISAGSNVFRFNGLTGKAVSLGSNQIFDRLYLDTNGNVGIGTTSPGQKLHVNGHCVTSDTLLPIRRRKKRRKYVDGDEEEEENGYENSTNGNISKNENADVDEEWEYLMVPIIDIKPGDEVLSLNKYKGKVEYHPIKGLMDMGVKDVYELRTKSGRVIRTTANHPYLVKMREKNASENDKKVVNLSQKTAEQKLTNVTQNVDSYITDSTERVKISDNRDILTPQDRDMSNIAQQKGGVSNQEIIENKVVEIEKIRNARDAEVCPYCMSTNFVKRGTRKNVNQVVQLYLCRNFGCGRTFSAQDIKGKHFPLHIIIESMSYYNIGLNFEEACRVVKQKFGVAPEPATLSDWINEYKMLCRYERLRPYAIKMFKPKDTIEVVTMAHRQLYRFRYHRAKTILMLEEFRNRMLGPLKNYLDNVSSETPHQYFQDGERMSEIKSKFDKADMIVRSKFNYANRLTAFVLQSIPDNKQRHEEIQRFMLANDSCTVATEVPVYIRKEDIEHMENELKFKISNDGLIELKGDKNLRKMPRLLTGHIDFVQIRNGQVHLLDYKPNASKEKPIEQLTWYALAMSRLTGLRLFNFVCAWFDDKDYYQFYPLHVVKKISGNKKRRVYYRSGEVVEIPKENELTIVPRFKDKAPPTRASNAPP